MHKPNTVNHSARYLTILQEGQEKGLDFFYQKYYSLFAYRAEKATQDQCAAESIVQEAFLRLWLFRENLQSEEDIFQFLKTQVKTAIHAYYHKTRNRFHRSLLRLDGIEDYQEFLLGYDLEEEEETEQDLVYLEQLEDEKQEKLKKLHALVPHLRKEQQLFIQLCLKYSFNYERIAYYLGGISDYEVSLQVEKTIEQLRQIFQSAEKMEQLNSSSRYVLQGEINEQQEAIFRMRYDLQYSFDQIADALNLNATAVRQLFIAAHTKLKSSKKTA